MLVTITDKNLFPRDFGDLQLNRGFVYTLFESKNIFIINELSSLQEEYSHKSEEIKMVSDEFLDKD